jgi:nucleotide-binding universal stress UspA family protein
MQRRIVIGYERTDGGRDALQLGHLLAEVLGAQPVVATVVPRPGPQGDEPAPDYFSGLEDQLAGFEYEARAIPSRTPVGGLRKLAADVDAPLIVLGSSNRGPAGRALLGSTGEALTHGAQCAIAVAPRGFADRPERRLLAIGAAFDGSGESWSALITAIHLVERTRGSLTIFTADDYPLFENTAPWTTLAAGELAGIEQQRKRRLLELALSATPAEVSAEGNLLSGDAGEAISAASEGLDLLLAGSRGHGLLRRTLLGSTTRRLLRGAGCPVVILPRQLRTDPLELDGHHPIIGPVPTHPVL